MKGTARKPEGSLFQFEEETGTKLGGCLSDSLATSVNSMEAGRKLNGKLKSILKEVHLRLKEAKEELKGSSAYKEL